MSTPSPTPEPEAKKDRSGLLTEAALLALSPLVAYSVAFVFETGYADYFGYPHYLIEVTLMGGLRAWASLALLGFFAYQLLTGAIGILPARPLRVLLFNRHAVRALVAAGLWWLGWYITWPLNSPWLGLVALAIAGLASWTFLSPLAVAYQAVTWEVNRLSRLGEAERLVTEAERKNSTFAAGTVAAQMQKYPGLEEKVGFLGASTFLPALFLALAAATGAFVANQQPRFMVTYEPRPQVILRRYGDYFVVAPINLTRHLVYPRFRLIPITDTITWVRAKVGPLRSSPSIP